MSDLVGNPEDRFSHNKAQIVSVAVQAGFESNLVEESITGFLQDSSSTLIIT